MVCTQLTLLTGYPGRNLNKAQEQCFRYAKPLFTRQKN
jgi:hypothetical protein